MATCLIGLGSNLGDRARQLDEACRRLSACREVTQLAVSSYHATPPVGGPPGQGAFLNAVARLEISLSPGQLLDVMQGIEQALGRTRHMRWDARPIDLDLLLYDEVCSEAPVLALPHPRMAFRRFVLEPACEVAADLVHPPTGWTLARLLLNLNEGANYVALAGLEGAGKRHVAHRMTQVQDVHWLNNPSRAEHMAGGPVEPAGLDCESELRFLSQRGRMLDRAQWRDDDRWSISDFWWDQSLIDAGWRLPPGDMDHLEQRWQELDRQVVRPKLTVWLDPPVETLLARLRLVDRQEQRSFDREDRFERLRSRLRRQALCPGRGPLLHLTTADLDEAVGEVTAAIDAMRVPPRAGEP